MGAKTTSTRDAARGGDPARACLGRRPTLALVWPFIALGGAAILVALRSAGASGAVASGVPAALCAIAVVMGASGRDSLEWERASRRLVVVTRLGRWARARAWGSAVSRLHERVGPRGSLVCLHGPAFRGGWSWAVPAGAPAPVPLDELARSVRLAPGRARLLASRSLWPDALVATALALAATLAAFGPHAALVAAVVLVPPATLAGWTLTCAGAVDERGFVERVELRGRALRQLRSIPWSVRVQAEARADGPAYAVHMAGHLGEWVLMRTHEPEAAMRLALQAVGRAAAGDGPRPDAREGK